jgi:sugar/nucleoside kinase (ribokinase family)
MTQCGRDFRLGDGAFFDQLPNGRGNVHRGAALAGAQAAVTLFFTCVL